MAINSILLVDDEEAVLKALTRVLQAKPEASYKVTPVSDPQEAARLVESGEKFDLLMTDVRMSPLDGLSLSERVRAELPDIEVVVISAYLNDELIENFKRRGCKTFIRKPFRMSEVYGALDSLAK